MDPDLADILFALDMRRSQGITVRLTNDELLIFDAQRLQPDALTLYTQLPTLPPMYKTGFLNGAPPDNWQKTENCKWALWDLVRAKRRLDKKSKENIILLLPAQSIEEPSEEAGDQETEGSEKGDIRTSEEDVQEKERQKGLRALVTGHPTQTVTLTEPELKVLFSATRALSQDKYKAVKADYEDYTRGQGFLLNSRDDDFRVHRIRNLHFDMDIVLSEIDDFNDPHIMLSILNILYCGSYFPAPLRLSTSAHDYPQPPTPVYGTVISLLPSKSGCGAGPASHYSYQQS